MKRTLAILLTVALVGGLLFMGTAAAQDTENENDQDAELDQFGANIADLTQEQNQANVNSLSGETNDGPLIQVQQTDQTNFGNQDANIDQEFDQEADLEQEIEDTVQAAVNNTAT